MAASSAPGGKRILAHLEHGAKPAAKPVHAAGWTIDGWTIGLGVLLLLMCSVAWLMHDKTITPSSFKHSDSSVRQEAAARQDAVRAAPEPEPEPELDKTARPAAIVNEAVVETASAAAALGTSAGAPQHPPVPLSVAATAPSLAAQPGTPHPVTTVRKPPAGIAASPVRSTATTASASRPAVAGATAASAGDTDVTLLAALVAHANKPTVVAPERSRDVVERQEGDSTAQLLARCKQLGLIEGMLCRSRICSGRWEADAACRAPAH